MTRRTFIVTETQELRELPKGTATEATDGRCVWIDVEDPEEAELSDMLSGFGFSRRAIRAAIALKGRTRVVSSGDETCFEFPALAAEIGSPRVALAFLCRPELVVTVHGPPVEGLSKTMNRLVKVDGLTGTDATAVVAALLAGLSSRAVDAVDEMRSRVLELQDEMERAPEEIDVAELQEFGSANRTLDAVIGERIVVLDRLRLSPSAVLDLDTNRDFQLAVSDAGYVDRVTDRIEKRLDNLRTEYSLYQQERTNRRLAVLTVLSAIFLPLTLLAGIYGMNFQVMPELGHPYGYPIALGSMVLVAVGMLAWFRWKGWLE